jgi:hypothetical protein
MFLFSFVLTMIPHSVVVSSVSMLGATRFLISLKLCPVAIEDIIQTVSFDNRNEARTAYGNREQSTEHENTKEDARFVYSEITSSGLHCHLQRCKSLKALRLENLGQSPGIMMFV